MATAGGANWETLSGWCLEASYNEAAYGPSVSQISNCRWATRSAYNEVDCEKSERATHEALAPTESINNLRADDGTHYANRVQAPSEPILR